MIDHPVAIAADHPCFSGHFPGLPILPAVAQFALLAEALAAMHGQACVIASIPSVKFLQPIRPGMALTVMLEPGGIGAADFTLRHDGTTVTKGSVRYRLEAP